MKKFILTFQAVCLCVMFLTGQQHASLNGKVVDPGGKVLAFSNVLLFNHLDSQMVKGEITGDKGEFEITMVEPGKYWVEVSYVGLPDYKVAPFVLKQGQRLSLDEIRMHAADNQLDEVVVKATKPLIEVKPDKMVFNVEGSINATGYDAMELLRKSPGVMIDNNDNIMLSGKNGVQVYINGKKSPLGTDDLASYLRTLQSSEIEAIEVITNPSSRYDAEGNAGIINIRLKKDKNLGANANIDLGYSIGNLPKYNGKISGNYRDQKYNVFGSYGYGYGENENIMNLYREQTGGVFNQHSDMGGNYDYHNFRLGSDYFLSEKSTIGFLANGNISDYIWGSQSRTEISSFGGAQPDSFLIAASNSDGVRANYNFNVNYQFRSKETSWNIDADYGIFRNDREVYQPNSYLGADEKTLLNEIVYQNNSPTDINIYTFKVDHERSAWGGKLGSGVKLALVTTDNIFDFYNVEDGTPILNTDRTNQFEYSENVNAAYLNYGRKVKKFNFQVGLRVEQTNSEGILTALKPVNDENVKRSYFDLFPSGGVTLQANQNNSFQLTYSRRIDRPNYQDLNPFESLLDELTFQKGNAFLNPQYSHNVQLTHTFKYRYNTSLSYTKTTDLITRITDTRGEKESFITWLNLADQQNISLNFSAPVQITKWWSSFANLSAYHTINRADYGDGKIVDLAATAFNIYSQQTFSVGKNSRFEISGWFNSPGLWGGTFKMNSMGALDIGFQQKILQGRGNLKVSVSDVLKTNKWGGTSQFGKLYMKINGERDSRRLKLNFSYLLGNDQVKSARRRKTGLEDEQRRIKSDN